MQCLGAGGAGRGVWRFWCALALASALNCSLCGDSTGEAVHWSLRAITRPAIPRPKDTAWGRTPVDGFVLDSLEKRGLRPAVDADRRTLIRRLSYDLIGLPP